MNLSDMKQLTSNQYDDARNKALARVQERIGQKPTRKQFKREFAPLSNVLDIFAVIIFGAAFAVSSEHIAHHIDTLVTAAASGTIGLHQVGYILMAEFSMLLFLVMFGIATDWRRWVFLALALIALLFLFNANLQSNIGALESVLPPLFTVGIGFRLEYLIVEQLRRRTAIDDKFQAALNVWEAATQDATKHPEFMPLLRTEIWNALVMKNKAFADSPIVFRRAAVARELERESWAKDDTPVAYVNGHGGDPSPLSNPLPLLTPEAAAN
jgi:hypothetical protein